VELLLPVAGGLLLGILLGSAWAWRRGGASRPGIPPGSPAENPPSRQNLDEAGARELTVTPPADLHPAEVSIKTDCQAVLEALEEGVLVLDAAGAIEEVNPALLSILQAQGTPPHWRGKVPLELFRIPAVQEAIDRMRSASVPGEGTMVARHASRVLGVRVCPLGCRHAGSPTLPTSHRVLVVWKDLTPLYRTEKAGRDLVANVAHQLRTPLTSIKGYSETLLDGALENQELAIRFLQIILRNADRLTALVRDVLTLARIEGDKETASTEPVNLNDIVASAMEALAPLAEKRGVRLTETFPEHPVVVSGNALDIEQACFNLLDNAVKYTARDTVVRVDLREEKGEAIFTVTDQGIGIPREEHERIFERFSRLDTEQSREVPGTGLGLAIVKEVVAAHGGRVRVQSMWGKGATFSIALPLAREARGG